MTDYEKIKNAFEAKAVCRHRQHPKLHCEPGVVWIECSLKDNCKCRLHQDSGERLSPMLANWSQLFTTNSVL